MAPAPLLLPPSPLGFRALQSDPVPEGVRDAYTAGIRAMLDWEPAIDEHGTERPHLLRLTPEAHAEWHAFAQAIEVQMQPGQELEHFTDWAGKAPGAAARGWKRRAGVTWRAAMLFCNFYDDFHTTDTGSKKIANELKEDLEEIVLKIFKKN